MTSYFTFREASEITGLNEATIRRLSKRPESKPYIQTKKGKKGPVFAIQADYLFGIYPRLKFDKVPVYLRIESDQSTNPAVLNQEATALLAAKDEIIQHLKDETLHLRNENLHLQKEIAELRLRFTTSTAVQGSKRMMHWVVAFWHTVLKIKRNDPYDAFS